MLPRKSPYALRSLLWALSVLICASAEPVAQPIALPDPSALPIAAPEAEADADPQTYNTYAPFSGAIYIVGANGVQVSQASPAICPNQAPQGCGNINIWNWCCPAGNSCALQNGVVGCCPVGSSCQGNINPAQIQTVTVTEYQQAPTVVVGVAGPLTTTTTAGNNHNTVTQIYNNFCSTLTAKGHHLPTTAAGQCGTILIVSGAPTPGRSLAWPLLALTTLLCSVSLGVLFR